MRVRSLILAAGLLVAPVAANAAAVDTSFKLSCGPHDEPALEVSVPAQAGTTLLVRIWGETFATLQSNKFLMLAPPAGAARAVEKDLYACRATVGCSITSGQIRIGQYRKNDFLDGEVIWHAESGEVTSIPFKAHFNAEPSPCG